MIETPAGQTPFAFGPYNIFEEVLMKKSPSLPTIAVGAVIPFSIEVPVSPCGPCAPVGPATPCGPVRPIGPVAPMIETPAGQTPFAFGPYNMFVAVFMKKSPLFPMIAVGTTIPFNMDVPVSPCMP